MRRSQLPLLLSSLSLLFLNSSAEAGDLNINATYLASGLTLNGVVDASKYGGGPAFVANFSNSDPSNPSRLYDFSKGSYVTSSTFSYDLYAAYSSTTLYLGFVVNDPNVVVNPAHFFSGTDIELFIGGNRIGNNFINYGNTDASDQAFQLAANTAGKKFTNNVTGTGGTFATPAWSLASSTVTSTGYDLEFAIPLSMIDTHTGGVYTPATAGSLLRFNVGGDVIAPGTNDFMYSVLDSAVNGVFPASNEFTASGANLWGANLFLQPVPEPSSVLMLGLGVGVAGLFGFSRTRKARTTA